MNKVEKKQLLENIRNYQSFLNEYKRLSEIVEKDGEITQENNDDPFNVTSRHKDASFRQTTESNRRRAYKRRMEIGKKLVALQGISALIKDDFIITIVDCLMDGMNVQELSRHLHVSHKTIYRKIDNVVDLMNKSNLYIE